MKSNYKRLGDYIVEVDIRNQQDKNLELWGVSIEKKFIKSVANIIGTDLSKYKVINKDCFVCSLMQVSRDEKIPIARWNDETEVIVSPAYKVFIVKDHSLIMPEFMDLWFKRAEFDREASFYGVGGVRGSLEWEDFCEMRIPVPPMEEQEKIVAAYETIEKRIALKRKINDNLADTAQAIYRRTFKDDIDAANLPENWHFSALGDVANLSAGGDRPAGFSDHQTGSCPVPIFSNGIEDEGLYGFTDKAKICEESVTVSARGTVGCVFLREEPYVPIVRLISVVPNKVYVTAKYLYFTLSSSDLHSTGTSQQQITVPDFKKRQILVPCNSTMADFMSNVEPLFASIQQNKEEIKILSALQSNFLAILSRKLSFIKAHFELLGKIYG